VESKKKSKLRKNPAIQGAGALEEKGASGRKKRDEGGYLKEKKKKKKNPKTKKKKKKNIHAGPLWGQEEDHTLGRDQVGSETRILHRMTGRMVDAPAQRPSIR